MKDISNQTICDHIHIKMSLAVQLIDDFTDKIITAPGIHVWIEGEGKPIKKQDGYYIFTNLSQETILLQIEAFHYCKETVPISVEKLNQLTPLVKIRLKPNRTYKLPLGTTCIEGKANPLEDIRLFFTETVQYRKLLYNYEKKKKEENEFIRIFNSTEADLDGCWFYISDREDKNQEFLSIVETINKEENIYRLERPLQSSYLKNGTKLIPVYHTVADVDGNYFIPVKEVKQEANGLRCIVMNQSLDRFEFVIEAGKINQFDMKQ